MALLYYPDAEEPWQLTINIEASAAEQMRGVEWAWTVMAAGAEYAAWQVRLLRPGGLPLALWTTTGRRRAS